jgi:hypothetical protein
MKALLFITTMLTLSFQTMAAQTPLALKCHTPRMAKAMKITNSKVTFYHERDYGNSRELASLTAARTRKTQTGFTKILNFEGQKHTIYIKNTKAPSELDDYITIRSRNGHEVIYPLTCSN